MVQRDTNWDIEGYKEIQRDLKRFRKVDQIRINRNGKELEGI